MKKHLFLISLLLFSLHTWADTGLHIENLQCANSHNPMGVLQSDLRLNWQIASQKHDVLQTAYRILVSTNSAVTNGNVWDSGKQQSGQSLQVMYGGKPLQPGKTYFWKVIVWTNKDKLPATSAVASWTMGLQAAADWHGAQWVAYEKEPESEHHFLYFHGNGNQKGKGLDVLPLLRKEISLNKPVKRAMMFICGLGQFELSVNGTKTGDHFLDPGWSRFDKQALYVGFDITHQLKTGSNAIGVALGNGFYHIPRERYRKLTGSLGYPKMKCRLIVEYADGTTSNTVSDESWKTAPSPVTFSSIYGGEDYDARLEQSGWNKPGFDAAKWKNAITVDGPAMLTAQLQSPLKVFNKFNAVSVKKVKPGVYLYDFGQNVSGIPAIAVIGKAGASVKIVPGELVDSLGGVNQHPSGTPSYFIYTLKGEGIERWQPQFMYYGFRYLQVEGAVPQGKANAQNLPVITAINSLHTRNAADSVGYFQCSNQLFNKIYQLINWAVKSNMSSVLTDCPHREKLGWLEVPQLLGNSIRYNYDIDQFYRKILQDMRMSQNDNGMIPSVAPQYVQFTPDFIDSPEWGSSSIIIPWYLYQWYGDVSVLRENYQMMKLYAAYLESRSKDHIVSHGLGEWFDVGHYASGYSMNTPQGITGTATYYYDLVILLQTAKLLGNNEDAEKYSKLAADTRESFNKTFFHADTKQYGTGSQAANAMAVFMGLVNNKDKNAVVANIVSDVKKRGNNLTTGEVGYRYLLSVLQDAGYNDLIFAMNNRSDVPGYGYQIAHGATTLMEDWSAVKSLGNNHCMLGHLMGWCYSGLGGIRAAEESIAFNHILIEPEPVGDIKWTKTAYRSPYGLISTDWHKTGKVYTLNVTIPANAIATVKLPLPHHATVTQNGRQISPAKSIAIGSGKYSFVVKSL